jgi:hypothetical protein
MPSGTKFLWSALWNSQTPTGIKPLLEGRSQSPQRQPQARDFCNGELKFYKLYNCPISLTNVDTLVYEGGSNDYYEVYTRNDLLWVSHMNFVLNRHRIPRWDV